MGHSFSGAGEAGYDAGKLVKVTNVKTGKVEYGIPKHIPMRGWNDYTLVATEETR
jgi:hypothetical protein